MSYPPEDFRGRMTLLLWTMGILFLIVFLITTPRPQPRVVNVQQEVVR